MTDDTSRPTPFQTLVGYALLGFIALATGAYIVGELGWLPQSSTPATGKSSDLAIWSIRLLGVAVIVKYAIDRYRKSHATTHQ